MGEMWRVKGSGEEQRVKGHQIFPQMGLIFTEGLLLIKGEKLKVTCKYPSLKVHPLSSLASFFFYCKCLV